MLPLVNTLYSYFHAGFIYVHLFLFPQVYNQLELWHNFIDVLSALQASVLFVCFFIP